MFNGISAFFKDKNYNPKEYWNQRTDPNNEKGNEQERVAFDRDYIDRQVRGSSSVLELGPGVGRTFDAYNKGVNVSALDISENYKEQLVEEATKRSLGISFCCLDRADSSFPYSDKKFPVGVASQVLLHIPPANIKHTISELVRTCEKVVIITFYEHSPERKNKKAKHVFNHDYIKIISELGCQIDNLVMKDKRIYFTVQDYSG
ncbi:class I SAM-dependent methyltransferase [Halospina sp. K52047b]|uniref:class I SAM-dependent methyltransferase n=1 Tax=Halospina sp. K52047b TaxID=2614160 RepID=UPI00124A1EBD|nr:class I SAM-dependent methyltransferase [Halospina sp. K52047b]KAA8976806.1 class I SAM-dependent methyltransferase [Halospina sp. K52047b]